MQHIMRFIITFLVSNNEYLENLDSKYRNSSSYRTHPYEYFLNEGMQVGPDSKSLIYTSIAKSWTRDSLQDTTLAIRKHSSTMKLFHNELHQKKRCSQKT